MSNRELLETNSERWERAMKDLSACTPDKELSIIEYLKSLNEEKMRLLNDSKEQKKG